MFGRRLVTIVLMLTLFAPLGVAPAFASGDHTSPTPPSTYESPVCEYEDDQGATYEAPCDGDDTCVYEDDAGMEYEAPCDGHDEAMCVFVDDSGQEYEAYCPDDEGMCIEVDESGQEIEVPCGAFYEEACAMMDEDGNVVEIACEDIEFCMYTDPMGELIDFPCLPDCEEGSDVVECLGDHGYLFWDENLGSIEGSVQADNLDVEASWVYVTLATGELMWNYIEEDGTFFLESLPEGVYELVIESNYVPYSMFVEVTAGNLTTLEPIMLNDGITVEGVVLDADGRPVPFAYVALWDEDGYGGDGEADAQGRFVITGLAAGSYAYLAESEDDWVEGGYDGDAIELTSEDERVEITITFPSLTTLTGIVTSATGAPVADAYVAAWSNDAGDYAWTDAQGRYTLHLPPGSYYVEAQDEEGRAAFAQDLVEIDADGATYDLRLGDDGSPVTGAVKTADGKAAKNVLVLLLLQDDAGNVVWGDSVVTDEKGEFAFEGIVEGNYEILAFGNDDSFVESTLKVAADGLKGAALTLSKAVAS